METTRPKLSEKYARRITLSALRKSKIHEQYEYGGLTEKAVSLRHDGLTLPLILDQLSAHGFSLTHGNLRILITRVIEKTDSLLAAYGEIRKPEIYIERPASLHDLRRSVAAMAYQQERLKEVLSFLRTAEGHGKAPIRALGEMSPEIFRKAAASDLWQAGGRMPLENPFEAIAVVIRPTEVRVAQKFLETLVGNICRLDGEIAEAMPVLDYGFAVFGRNLKAGRIPAFRKAPVQRVAARQEQVTADAPQEAAVQVSAQPEGLSEISRQNLERNTHHIRGYLRNLESHYTPAQMAERHEHLLEDIFQITKNRVAALAKQHDLGEAELRAVFKHSIIRGLEVFETRTYGREGLAHIEALVTRAETEPMVPCAKPRPKSWSCGRIGVLQAYVNAMSC